jgi:predicted nucleotidyltransferase
MAMNPNIETHLDAIQALCRRYRVHELSVFGSVLRADFGPQSDIDFLVEFEPDAEVGFLEFASLQNALSDLLHRKVDLVPKAGLKPVIREEVLASAQVVHAA